MTTSSLLGSRFSTTVAKELVVGITGVVLVLFVLAHLSGNLLLLLGRDAFNMYAERLHSLGELIWVARAGLLVAFVAHIAAAISLARENAAARGDQRYEVQKHVGRKTFASRLMLISGVLILIFVVLHVYDFTISGDPAGDRSIIPGTGDTSAGLYGVVFSSFMDPIHSLLYILAVCFVGLHLSHAIASVASTLGFLTDKNTGKYEKTARAIGIIVAVGFSSIPLYVLLRAHVIGV